MKGVRFVLALCVGIALGSPFSALADGSQPFNPPTTVQQPAAPNDGHGYVNSDGKWVPVHRLPQ